MAETDSRLPEEYLKILEQRIDTIQNNIPLQKRERVRVNFPAGFRFIEQGIKDPIMYILTKATETVKVSQVDKKGKPLFETLLEGRGTTIGEMNTLAPHALRSASVTAITNIEGALQISSVVFRMMNGMGYPIDEVQQYLHNLSSSRLAMMSDEMRKMIGLDPKGTVPLDEKIEEKTLVIETEEPKTKAPTLIRYPAPSIIEIPEGNNSVLLRRLHERRQLKP